MSRVATPPVVAELIADGRGVAARPAFERGLHVAIGPKGRRGAKIGDLVTIRARGGGADVIARHGRASSARDAMQALVADAGLWADFPKAVLAEAEEQASGESEEDAGRLDLRAQRVITIDPDGAKDHDDTKAGPDGDRAAFSENANNVFRRGRTRNVVVLRRLSQELIANTASCPERFKAFPSQDLHCLRGKSPSRVV